MALSFSYHKVDPTTSTFQFPNTLLATENFLKESLTQKLKHSEGIIVLMSENTSHSKWTAFEAGIAKAYGLKVVLVSLDNSIDNIPMYLKDYISIDGSKTPLNEVADRIKTLYGSR